MQKKSQNEGVDELMKRPILRRKIGIVHLEMIKESRSLYGMERFTDPRIAAGTVGPLIERASREMFLVISFDTKMTPMALEIVAVGSVNTAHVQMRDIFQHAVLNNAKYLMCFHNHPSGEPDPSTEDKLMTEKIRRSGELMGIELVDHIIIGDEGNYYSFREAGILSGTFDRNAS